jgi:hypothetical protein
MLKTHKTPLPHLIQSYILFISFFKKLFFWVNFPIIEIPFHTKKKTNLKFQLSAKTKSRAPKNTINKKHIISCISQPYTG